jgi:hypothetical protein
MVLAILTILGNWKMFQTLGEKAGEAAIRWLETRPQRRLARRVPDVQQQALVLRHEQAEAETLVNILRAEYQADRVTLVEYDCPKDAPTLATCRYESCGPAMPSVRWTIQSLALEPEAWAWVQEIYSLPSRYLFVPDVLRLSNGAVRSQLLRSGVRAGYYQALPATAGHCGALLAISWGTPLASLHPDDLAALQWSGRLLGALQRTLWAFRLAAA